MKILKYWKVVSTIFCLFVFTSCVFDNGEEGVEWLTVDVEVNETSRNVSGPQLAASGATASLIVVVHESNSTVTTSNYLPVSFDQQL